ncbi:MAG: YfhO family protein [Coriobacteriia bacterium]|nr:YfhO family protein [Coriobacteriia bacterium]
MIRLRQDKKKRALYYAAYSIMFAVIAAIVFSWFYLNKKALVWTSDGVRQHLVAMTYYGQYLRQILFDLIHTGRFVAPHFDFSIGYGSDVLTTLNWYAIGDPLNLLFAAVPAQKATYLYSALIVLRMYLMGIAFSAYCQKLKLSRSSQLFGSITYVFCGFVLQAIVHPNFLNPMIYLPLLFIGVEQVFRKQRPYFFIVIVCLAAVTDFYFFYVLSILLILYIVIRFVALVDKKSIKGFFSWAGRFALYYLTGLAMACLLFLPVVMYMLSTNRAGIHQTINIFYSTAYYFKLIPGFIVSNTLGPWTYFGFTAFSFAAVILLFSKRKAHTALKFAFILLLVFLMLPIMGTIFNGLSYVTNRWMFGLSFVVALITAIMLPEIMKPTKKQLLILTIATALYSISMFITSLIKITGFIPAYLIVVLLLLCMWGSYFYRRSSRSKQRNRWSHVAFLFVLLIIMASSIVISAYYKNAPTQGNFVSEFTGSKAAIKLLTKNSSSVVKSLGDKSFYRYDENEYGGQTIIENRSMLQHENSTGFYFSLSNPHMIDYFTKDIGLFVHQNCSVYSLDNRTFVSTLASVKYFVVKPGLKQYLPYGYDKRVKQTKTYRVYENSYSLPLGYTYDKIIPKVEYDRFSPAEKQQALLQGAVIDSNATLPLDTATPAFNDEEIPYRAQCSAGVARKNNTFIVTKAHSSVVLSFSGMKDCETYLYLKNLNYTGTQATRVTLTIKSGKVSKKIGYQTPDFNWYADQHDYLVNMGYAAKPKSKITLEFGSKGTYSLDDLQVVCQPMSAYGAQVKALQQSTLKNVHIGTDQVTGTIDTSAPKLLCLTVPYSDGWAALVDGKKAELFNVNTMWCGLYLPAGNHTVTLHYQTPYYRQGCILSLIGLALLIAIIVSYERKQKAGLRQTRGAS